MTENDRTVQVPVSLIQDVLLALRENTPQSTRVARGMALHALLPQPTPTAEPMTLDQRAVQAFGPGVLERTAPPRIEDLAPGTRIAVAHSWTVMRKPGGPTFLYCEDNGYARVALPSDIDPSTIRDVTPPAVTE